MPGRPMIERRTENRPASRPGVACSSRCFVRAVFVAVSEALATAPVATRPRSSDTGTAEARAATTQPEEARNWRPERTLVTYSNPAAGSTRAAEVAAMAERRFASVSDG